MVFLPGGPPHQDMWEIKTQAPREIRGEFNPIATSVPGVQIGELFPRLAGMMEKLVAIRSLIGCRDEHVTANYTIVPVWVHSCLVLRAM